MTDEEKELSLTAVKMIAFTYKKGTDQIKKLWETAKKLTSELIEKRGSNEEPIQKSIRCYEAFICSLAETLMDKLEKEKCAVFPSNDKERRKCANIIAHSPLVLGCTTSMIAELVHLAEELEGK